MLCHRTRSRPVLDNFAIRSVTYTLSSHLLSTVETGFLPTSGRFIRLDHASSQRRTSYTRRRDGAQNPALSCSWLAADLCLLTGIALASWASHSGRVSPALIDWLSSLHLKISLLQQRAGSKPKELCLAIKSFTCLALLPLPFNFAASLQHLGSLKPFSDQPYPLVECASPPELPTAAPLWSFAGAAQPILLLRLAGRFSHHSSSFLRFASFPPRPAEYP